MKRKIGYVLMIIMVLMIILAPMAALADDPYSPTYWYRCIGPQIGSFSCLMWAILHGIDNIIIEPF